jgi:hypothetical protein
MKNSNIPLHIWATSSSRRQNDSRPQQETKWRSLWFQPGIFFAALRELMKSCFSANILKNLIANINWFLEYNSDLYSVLRNITNFDIVVLRGSKWGQERTYQKSLERRFSFHLVNSVRPKAETAFISDFVVE